MTSVFLDCNKLDLWTKFNILYNILYNFSEQLSFQQRNE